VLDLPVAGETKGNDAQIALMDGAQNIPLLDMLDEVSEEPPMTEGFRQSIGRVRHGQQRREEEIYLELARKRQSRGQTQSNLGWVDGCHRGSQGGRREAG